MGSVKDLITIGFGSGYFLAPAPHKFGEGTWEVSGRFSVGDLKYLIPESNIQDKAEALTMMAGAFFEWLAEHEPAISTTYVGVLDPSGALTDVKTLLEKGEKTHHIVMKLANVPSGHYDTTLQEYRKQMLSGEITCGVADVECIFRAGFPLGSSTFEKIFKAVGSEQEYARLATYDETVQALDEIRAHVLNRGLQTFGELEKLLRVSGLGETIPNPGFILKHPVYDSTTKFEEAGDRKIPKEEERVLSFLSEEGYELWNAFLRPTLTRAQIQFCKERGVLNIDGKVEIIAYKGDPVVADFVCTPDENRLMIAVDQEGEQWAFPTNKEIQRAIFRKEGVYLCIADAKQKAQAGGKPSEWKTYMSDQLKEHNINLREVSDYSCQLMSSALQEVANRILGKRVFDARPLKSLVSDFLPYASKIEYQV